MDRVQGRVCANWGKGREFREDWRRYRFHLIPINSAFYKNFKGSTDVFQVKENVHAYISMYLF